MIAAPDTIDSLREQICGLPCLVPRGGGSKPALSLVFEGAVILEVSSLRGMVEYQPQEFTFTALAGTPLAEVNQLLAQHGQYLPCDPPLAGRGATLGGTVAAGLSGPGRYHYGGLRDFILGVRFISGKGELLRGGGKVVKNAAGFDFPKLMVGSLGRLGVIVELSFKVFPRPEAYATLRIDQPSLTAALETLNRLLRLPLEIDAIDLTIAGAAASLWVRLGGLERTLQARIERLRGLFAAGEILSGAAEEAVWEAAREFTWVPPDWSLVKVPITPRRISGFEQALAEGDCQRRYSAGGQVAWLAIPEPPQALDPLLSSMDLSGLALFGGPGPARIGVCTGDAFLSRVKAALDPDNRFPEV